MSDITSKTICRIIIDVLHRQGVRHAVCSPGSRNAPLLMAVDECRDISTDVVVDERQAAFLALGRVQASGNPVALVCTSGTAMLNYAPAVAEAYYQGLPLIVVSADRPQEWIDQDDSQTLRQFEALKNFVKESYDIAADPELPQSLWYANRLANDAMLRALGHRPGPVHINVRIDVPIGRTDNRPLPRQRIVRMMTPVPELTTAAIKDLAVRTAGQRILVVAGFLAPSHSIIKGIGAIARLSNVHVMCESISNIFLSPETRGIDSVLCTLDDKELDLLAPDIVITLGGALVSRHIKEYLRRLSCNGRIEHWALGLSHTTVDCFKALTLRIETEPGRFLSRLAGSIGRIMGRDDSASENPGNDTYRQMWNMRARAALASHDAFLTRAPWSSLLAFDTILRHLPARANLYLSNGTPIRYAQLFSRWKCHACRCNRGVSGIEGQIATACGGADTYDGLSVCIIGDTSFCHDISSLMAASRRRNLRIIVINNNGGEIFRFISSTATLQTREHYFCAPQPMDIGAIARAFGLLHERADSQESLQHALEGFFHDSGKASILEVCVPSGSAETLKAYFSRATR